MPTIKVEGMSCQHCAASVTSALNEIKGIKQVEVDLQKGEVAYTEEAPVELQEVKEAINRAGYKAR